MQANHMPLDNLGDLGIFNLMAQALNCRPATTERHERADFAAPPVAAAPASRRSLFDRLDDSSWRKRQRDVEAHLGQANDVYDLETRIRDLERGARCLYG